MDPRILQHLNLVIEANKTTNLTRITSLEEAKVLHIEDSLSALDEVNAAPEGKYGDMGTGAGYPGIPLALVTQRQTVLMDSVGKKTKILDSFIEQLGIGNYVTTYNGRIEDLARTERDSYSLLTARALSKLGSLMELASPLLIQGGRLVCYKSHVDKDEIDHGMELQRKLGLKMISDREFYLSDEKTLRRIIVFEKSGHPQIKLPRAVGAAQKKPL